MSRAEDVKEILDSRREFSLGTPEGENLVYYIANPTGEDIRKADWRYSKVYNQAIVDDFLTQAQMLELLKDKGIIDDDYTSQVENVRLRLAAELFRLENLDEDVDEGERESAALEVARLREDLFTLNQRVNGPMGNTCENLAEDARVEFLTSRIIQKKDGNRLWENFEDYEKEENNALSVKSRFEVMLWMQGLDSNFMENTPEQRALTEIQQKRIDEAIAELEKREEQEAKDTQKEPKVEEIELKEQPAKKKVVRKKKTSKVEIAKKKPGRPRKQKPEKEE